MFGLSDNLLLHFVSSWGFKTFLVLHDYLLGREKIEILTLICFCRKINGLMESLTTENLPNPSSVTNSFFPSSSSPDILPLLHRGVICCPMRWGFKARMKGRGRVKGSGVCGLLLHFIRKLIRRLLHRIVCLCPLSLLSSSSAQREKIRSCQFRRLGRGEGSGGSVQFTSHHFI